MIISIDAAKVIWKNSKSIHDNKQKQTPLRKIEVEKNLLNTTKSIFLKTYNYHYTKR